MERLENELRKLIEKARKMMSSDLDNCVDWIEDQIRLSKKSIDNIEKIQRQSTGMNPELFNDSRDCCEELRQWLKKLNEHRDSLLNKEQRIVVQTLDELGSLNDGFRRSRTILFTK